MKTALIAIDVDGTLVGDDLVISESDRTAIETALREGWRICLASGRLFAASRPFAQALHLGGPIIVLQGAVGYDLGSGKRLFCTPLARRLALAAFDFLKNRGFHMQLYYGDSLYLDELNDWARYYLSLSRVEPVMVSDLRALLTSSPPVEPGPIKVLGITQPDTVAATIPDLKSEMGDKANVFRSLPPFLEVTDLQANKGDALRKVASLLGIGLDATAAIGDADNDIPMFATAARSFALSSGSQAAKAAAQVVVGKLGSGVAQALRILEEERMREPA